MKNSRASNNIKRGFAAAVAVLIIVCLSIALMFGGVFSLPHSGSENDVTPSSSPSSTTITEVENRSLSDRYIKKFDSAVIPQADDVVDVIVKLKGDSLASYAHSSSVHDFLTTSAGRTAVNRLASVRNKAISSIGDAVIETGYTYSAVFNGFSAKTLYKDISKIESDPNVESVILSDTYSVPKDITVNEVDVYSTGIFDSSSVSYDGTGTVVAVLDTGTDYTHEVFDMELDPDSVAIDKDDVARVAESLSATKLAKEKDLVINEDNLYISSKLPYAFDYADYDDDVYPSESHGTHVAGIIAGKSERITGVATGAQIATFKVFSDYSTGAPEHAILGAINDAVILGVDVINMSLGSSSGFSREGDDDAVNEIYDAVQDAGICLVVAASNDYSSAKGSANGDTNLASNPDSGTVGSPASYSASLAVASVAGIKTKYMVADGNDVIYFTESSKLGAQKHNDFVAGILGTEKSGEFDYVVVPGIGMEINYSGLDLHGKIAVVKRGTNSFEEKVRIAQSFGAVGVIVYNNVSGTISMSVGTADYIPSCSISMDLGKILVERGSGKLSFSQDYLAGPFMSDFSSWGVLPDLELKPDITAHGGEILSAVVGTNEYDTYSGTSMACPNLAGALVLVRQYVKERYPDYSTEEVRDLAYSLMMSTATIVRNQDGNPYSPRKQGAGLSDIYNSVNTKAYLTVDGQNKPKLSLGDDPERTGVYALKFNVVNTQGEALNYDISPVVMTETMSSDERTVAELAYMFNDASFTCKAEAVTGSASVNGTSLIVGGYSQAAVTVIITLSDADKKYLNDHFVNGMYVEGYITLKSFNADKIGLSLPYLVFYGDWTDAPMLDVTEYQVGESKDDSSVLEEDKLVADVYGTIPYAGFSSTDEYGNDQLAYWGLGAFGYNLNNGYETPTTREQYASLTSNGTGNLQLYMINAGLLRGAKRVDMSIRDSITGEVIWTHTDYNARKSYASGGTQVGGHINVEFNPQDLGLANNSVYTFSMECFLDWKDGNCGKRNTFSFDFTIDNEAPELVDTKVREVDNGSSKQYFIDFYMYDNHYMQCFIPYTYSGLDDKGSLVDGRSLAGGVVPVYNGEHNGTTVASLDVTAYWNEIMRNGGKIYVELVDYAKNSTDCEIVLAPETDVKVEKIRTAKDSYSIQVNGQIDLKKYIQKTTLVGSDYVENYWTEDLVWSSSDESVATVRDGVVTGIADGKSAEITVKPKKVTEGIEPVTFTINVSGSKEKIDITGIKLSDSALMLERGETVELTATVEPYNFEGDVDIEWTSTGENVVVTVDPQNKLKATVFAKDSGYASVRATVKGTLFSGYCDTMVQEEFRVDGVYLRKYTGRGDENGVVEIPDDLGIVYIYPTAFLNNKYITKVIIPDGVIQVMYASFYGCENLKEVVLPETLTTIGTWAFGHDTSLEKINLENVNVIGYLSFYNCEKLREIDLSSATFIKYFGFAYCDSLTSLDLTKVGEVGEGSFYHCAGLKSVVIPEKTTLGPRAFAFCENLDSLVIRSSHIGEMAFAGCSSLLSVSFINDVDLLGDYAFYGCTSLEKADFFGSCYEIGDYAFYGCTRLSSFTFPDGLEVLGQYAFTNCTALKKINVAAGAKLTSITAGALNGCNYVNAFTVEDGNKYLSAYDGVLYDKTMTRLVLYPLGRNASRTFVVPDSVTTIGPSAFFGVNKLDTVDLNNVTEIGEAAFRSSTIDEITGYDNLKVIGDYAFALATIKNIPVSNKTTYIGDYAFNSCTYFTSDAIVIPDNVTYLGVYSFAGTKAKSVKLGSGVEKLLEGAFYNCKSLTTVDLGSVKEIDSYAFAECEEIASVTIPSTVTKLGKGMFINCKKLASVNFADGCKITEIPESAFADTILGEIALPATVTAIGDSAFSGTNIESIALNGVSRIGNNAFKKTKLKTVSSTIVDHIGDGAFEDCTSLAAATFPSATHIGDSAFSGDKKLANVKLDSAEYVGNGAFKDCTALTSVSVDKAKEIGDNAFSGASALKTVSFAAAESIGECAFERTAVESVEMPASVNMLHAKAFYGAKQLKTVNVDDGNKLYFDENGIVYRRDSGNYFTLMSYPMGKTDKEYVVKDRTIRIDSYAFNSNTSIEKITLPIHVRVIGASALGGLTSLKTLVINSAAAPVLESLPDENGKNVYNNIKYECGYFLALTLEVPKNNTGYANYIWAKYAEDYLSVTDKVSPILGAINFMDRVVVLPAEITEADRDEINTLVKLFNSLNAEQKAFVTGSYDGTDYYALLTAAQAKLPAEPEPENPDDGEKGLPAWAWALIGVGIALVVAGIVVAVILIVRKKKKTQKDGGDNAEAKETPAVNENAATSDSEEKIEYATETPTEEKPEDTAEVPEEKSEETVETPTEEKVEDTAEVSAEKPEDASETAAEEKHEAVADVPTEEKQEETAEKKPAAKKPATTAAKKPAAKSASGTAAKKPAAKSASGTAAKKPAAKSASGATAKKPAAKSASGTTAKKPAAKSTASTTAKKPAAKKVGTATKTAQKNDGGEKND